MPLNIFITGGTTGIGFELAKLYAREGHCVGICGRDLSKLPKDVRETSSIQSYSCDVTDREKLHRVIKDFSRGTLHKVVANAGISMGKKSRKPNFEMSRRIFRTNVFGVLHTFEAALELMLPRKEGQLVAVSSVAAMVGLPGAGAYSASKAAVLRLCESYAIDLKDHGISVTCICPGFIKTPLTDKNDHSMPFLLTAEEGARRIKKAVDQQKALYIFPWPMKIAITILEKMPRYLYRLLMQLPFFNYSRE